MYPLGWDEYRIVLAIVSSEVISVSNGMGVSFLYESAKDVLRWHNLSIKEYVKTVMSIGNYLFLDDKSYLKAKNSINSESKPLSGDDIDRMAQAQERVANGSNQN